jgi:hypothetical protein
MQFMCCYARVDDPIVAHGAMFGMRFVHWFY